MENSFESFKDPIDEDEAVLNQMGYKQELYRGFSSLMNFSFCFTAVAVVSSLSGLFPTAMATGGPVVIIWSWIVGSLLTYVVAANLAEICSTYPSAGSVYHWSGMMCTEKHSPFISYVTGWFNFIGNGAADAFFANAFAATLNALIETCGYPSLSVYATTAIAGAVLVVWTVQNFLRIDIQGVINNFAAFWQIGTLLTIIGTLWATCSSSVSGTATNSQMFFTFYNGTGFESVLYVCMIGMLSTLYSFTGYEAAAHMSEETRHAKKSAPYGVIYTVLVSSVVGFLYLLGLLYPTANDVESFVSQELSVNSIFEMCAGNSLAILLSFLLTVNMYFSGSSSTTVTGRIAFAMARDGAFPYSEKIKFIGSNSHAPIGAVTFVLIVDLVLISLNLFSETAFVAITSLATIGFQLSYAIPIGLRASSTDFEKSEFNLGNYGRITAGLSCAWLTITSCLFILPTSYPITSENMNYTGIVLLGCAIIGGLHWSLSARKWFVGPKRHHKETLDNI
ncbi:amino acid/polyamine transporter I [Globomyces pollinis-pini]|nr:amino acid/polyamine transporter I [Globomyces pollinis-pini]